MLGSSSTQETTTCSAAIWTQGRRGSMAMAVRLIMALLVVSLVIHPAQGGLIEVDVIIIGAVACGTILYPELIQCWNVH
jgi:Na+/H+ antiporter NhaB